MADGVSLTIAIDICYREELCALCEIQHTLWLRCEPSFNIVLQPLQRTAEASAEMP